VIPIVVFADATDDSQPLSKEPKPMAPSFIRAIRSSSVRQRQVLLVASFLACFYFITHWSPHSVSVSLGHAPLSTPLSPFSVVLPESKYAYAAFLAAPQQESDVDADDNYFVATRMLAYQLLHDPVTRTKQSIPFLVAVTDEVTQRKRDRLAADGAVVVPVEKISFSWIHPSRRRWRDVLTKLRLFQLTQYERIFFLDSDMLIVKCMDAIFADAASVLALNANRTERMKADEGPQPTSYVFAGVSGQGGYDHPWPPRKGRAVNAGFILFQPSMDLFHHYMTVAAIEGRFDSKYPEQNLWNYVHRREGNMPWAQLTATWNVNWPTMNDYNNGVASLHAKFWDAEAEIRDLLLRSRWKMEGSAEARDEVASLASIL